MKHLLLAMFALTGAVIAAEGAHYDFYQKNGQNVLGAEIVAESETEYTVRLSYVPTPIKILKSSLKGEPVLSAIQPKPPEATQPFLQREFTLHASAGYAFFNSGQVATIFGQGYRGAFGTDWLLFREPLWRIQAITATFALSRFQNSTRYIQIADLQLGPKFIFYHWPLTGVSFFATPTVGIAQVNLKGYTFDSAYTNLTGALALQAEKRLGPVVAVLQLHTNSLFDQSQVFTATTLSLAAAYPITAGAMK
ncbi:hypothetical protein [Turneriella parva]|uniref:Uncharacterized protein n=1 Tax=Turneriella parva (strain ATCC BAA-1111 / DSM 21527 / NCTC 11395 / H) TaxID=869212 RepID=I4B6F9_TURPD|nr:hypothetical protein [Turneriella parva]AFM12866.1 hypothetical protein Turpa_2221 [Turneriella parva DSM 21527]